MTASYYHWWCDVHRTRRRSVWPSVPAGGRPFAWCDESVFLRWVHDRDSVEPCFFVPHPDQSGKPPPPERHPLLGAHP